MPRVVAWKRVPLTGRRVRLLVDICGMANGTTFLVLGVRRGLAPGYEGTGYDPIVIRSETDDKQTWQVMYGADGKLPPVLEWIPERMRN